MFGLGINKEHKNLAFFCGKVFQYQFAKAATETELMWTPDQIAFTSGYIKGYLRQLLLHSGSSDYDLERKLLKIACNEAYPKGAWNIFLRGEAMAALAKASTQEPILQSGIAYKNGQDSGNGDANMYLMTDEEDINPPKPVGLASFLIANQE